MRNRLLLILAIAALIGFVTSYLVYQVVARVQASAPKDATATILVASANMNLGETVTSRHVKTVSWPKSSVPAGAVSNLAEVEGRIVRSSIVIGEPLLEAKLAPRMAGHGGLMAVLVPEGQRAVTIKVDDAIRETGFILPSSYIDVLVSMQQSDGRDKIAKVILQDVQVLASGQTVELRDNKPVTMTTLTLALTPDQVERLTLAQTEGRLFFVTRNLNDKQVVKTRGVTKATLLSDAAPPAPPSPARRAAAPPARPQVSSPVLPPPVIESVSVSVLRGTKVSEHQFVKKGREEWVEKSSGRE